MFLENADVSWVNTMRDDLLKQDDFNIIIVDWSNGAKSSYEQAVGNTRMLGAQIAELISFLVKNTNTSTDAFYILGFDLGAHASGFAGKIVTGKIGKPLGRITGMPIHRTINLTNKRGEQLLS